MQFIVVIPARYGSTRLPGKPLRDIAGQPMIQRVWQQACKSAAARVVIATDDSRIEAAALKFGAEVCMTSADHVSGTDRLQELAQLLELADSQILVNVQGDEPLIPPSVINQVAANLAANIQAGVATLCEPVNTVEDFCNASVVKLVADAEGLARYFSRAPIPWPRDQFADNSNAMPEPNIARRHIGIYAYRVAELTRFVGWPVAPTEQAESLEQLLFIWNSVAIHVADALESVPPGVDTEEDLQKVSKLIGAL